VLVSRPLLHVFALIEYFEQRQRVVMTDLHDRRLESDNIVSAHNLSEALHLGQIELLLHEI
jgi:hypothetical protein